MSNKQARWLIFLKYSRRSREHPWRQNSENSCQSWQIISAEGWADGGQVACEGRLPEIGRQCAAASAAPCSSSHHAIVGWSVYIVNVINEDNIAENTAQLQELHHQCRSHHAVVGLGSPFGSIWAPCLLCRNTKQHCLELLMMNNCL